MCYNTTTMDMDSLFLRSIVPPSAAHAAAEQHFERQVELVVQRALAGHVVSLCTDIDDLDSVVTSGAVRRAAAAKAASRLWRRYRLLLVTLLHEVLNNEYHVRGCMCVPKVLSWGTCPTGVQWDPTPQFDHYPLWTAIGLAHGVRHGLQWVPDLLAYGSVPWEFLNKKHRGWTLTKAEGQWHRWHNRTSKRQWLRCSFALAVGRNGALDSEI
jgi:hypothetical protein